MPKRPAHLPPATALALGLAVLVAIASACSGDDDSAMQSETQAEMAALRGEMDAMQGDMQDEMAQMQTEAESQMAEMVSLMQSEMAGMDTKMESSLQSEMQTEAAEMMAEMQGGMTDLRAEMRSETADVAERVKQQVAAAIERYEEIGEAAFEEITYSGDYLDGELYVYVIDADGVILAQAANPDLVDVNNYDLQDSTGAYLVRGILDSATPEGTWVTYRFTNPATGREEPKRSWAVAHDGLVFGSGYYNDLDALVKEQVARAIERYEEVGADAFEEITSSGDYIDGEIYVFVGDAEGVILAHAANPDLAGQNLYDLQYSTGAYIVRGILDSATPEGAWTVYRFTNPVTGQEEPKHTWAVSHDGLVFGSGRYANEAELAQDMVADAIARYREVGTAVFEEITAGPGYASGEVYVYVVGPDGTNLAHAVNPDLVGQDLSDLQDSAGVFVTRGILDTATPEGAWTVYRFTNPVTGQEEPKHSWVVSHNGLVFGSGYYTDS